MTAKIKPKRTPKLPLKLSRKAFRPGAAQLTTFGLSSQVHSNYPSILPFKQNHCNPRAWIVKQSILGKAGVPIKYTKRSSFRYIERCNDLISKLLNRRLGLFPTNNFQHSFLRSFLSFLLQRGSEAFIIWSYSNADITNKTNFRSHSSKGWSSKKYIVVAENQPIPTEAKATALYYSFAIALSMALFHVLL